MVDVTVFEQAPQLQAGQLKEAGRGSNTAESAVERIDGPELSAMLQHLIHHLLGTSRSVRASLSGGGIKTNRSEATPDLFALSFPLSGGHRVQQTLDVHSHVWWEEAQADDLKEKFLEAALSCRLYLEEGREICLHSGFVSSAGHT